MVACRLMVLLLATLPLALAGASNNVLAGQDWYTPEPMKSEPYTKPISTTTAEIIDNESMEMKEEETPEENSEAATRILSLLEAALRNRPAADLEELQQRLQQALQQQGLLAGLDPLAPGGRSLENPLPLRQRGLLDSLALRRAILDSRVLRRGLLDDQVLGRGLLDGEVWRSGLLEEQVYGRSGLEVGLLERGLVLQRPRWQEANGRVAALATVRRLAPYSLGEVLTTGKVCHSCRTVRVPGVRRRQP